MCINTYMRKATSQTRVHEVAFMYLRNPALPTKPLNTKHLPPPKSQQLSLQFSEL